MGAAESSPKSGSLPEGVTKVNDSLYELYSPAGTPEVDIIFFHGLQANDYIDAYWKTWSRDGKTIWPRTLLGKKLPGARILSVSYDACARVGATAGRMDIFQIAERLVHDIILHDRVSVGRNQCPVILVGHSFGGFVIKQFLKVAFKSRNFKSEIRAESTARIVNFLNNVSGIFYYATPHGGSKLANRVHRLPGNNHDVLGFLTTLGKESGRLNEWFRDWRAAHKIPAFSMAESRPTTLWRGLNLVVVEEGSARADTDGYYTASTDHINVCKPEHTRQATFQCLYDFTKQSVARRTQTLTLPSVDDC